MTEPTAPTPVPDVPDGTDVIEHPIPIHGDVRIAGRTPPSDVADFGAYKTIVLAGTEDKQILLPYDKNRVRGYILVSASSPSPGPTTTTQGSTTGAVPTAGAEQSITVPAGQIWAVSAIAFSLTTSVTVANRQITLVIDNGTNDVFRMILTITQAASLTYEYVFSAYTNDTSVRTIGANNEVLSELPLGLPLGAGYRIRTVTTNLQAGDQYTAAVIDYQLTTSNTTAAVYIGSEAQCAAIKLGNTAGGGFYLPVGQSLTVAHKDPVWMIPDGTHACTVSVVQERMRV